MTMDKKHAEAIYRLVENYVVVHSVEVLELKILPGKITFKEYNWQRNSFEYKEFDFTDKQNKQGGI